MFYLCVVLMSNVLYRRYRPQTFSEIIGQEHICDVLKSAVLKDMVSHAYLLMGPRGLGKTSTARIIAKALNCNSLTKEGDPCNKCENCKAIANGNFFDLIEVDAASNRGIDQIRELREKISFQPTVGRKKVYIIDEVHMLTKEAFNALLKTLEEPPSHVVFVLATTEGYKLPATILSRCQRFDFRLASGDMIEKHLLNVLKKEKRKVSSEGLQIISRLAKGSYRDALSLLDVVLSGSNGDVGDEDVRKLLHIPDDTMVYYFLENMLTGDKVKAVGMLSEIYEKGVDLHQFTYMVLETLKSVLIDRSSLEGYKFFDRMTDFDIMRLIRAFVNAEQDLRNSQIPTLPLEMAVWEWGMATSLPAETESQKVSLPSKKAVKNSSTKSTKELDIELDPETNVSIKSEELHKKWKDVVSGIKKYNGHLYAFLNQAEVKNLEKGTLTLTVGFEFHRDRIMSPHSKVAIQSAFEKVFKVKPKIICEVCKDLAQKQIGEVSSKKEVKLEGTPAGSSPSGSADEFAKEVEDIFKDI